MRFSSSPNRPSAWKEMKLADVCKTFTSGGTPSRKKPEYFENGTVPWVRTKELNDGVITEVEEFITLEALKNSSAKILPKDSVLLAMYGATVGKLGVLGIESSCNQACAAMVPKDGIVDYRFLYYLLLNHRELIISQATGGAQQNLSGELIKGFTFDFPTFNEQEAISEVLWNLDEKIRVNNKVSKTLEELAQTIFKSWFIDFDPVKAKVAGEKPVGIDDETASLFPDSFEESELGLIPKGWEAEKFGEVNNLLMGQSPPGDTYNSNGEGLPFYQGRTDFGFRFPKKRIFCTQENRVASPGETLISVRAPVGDVNQAVDKCIIGRGVASALHKSNSSAYTFALLKSLYPRLAYYNGEGTVFGAINRSDFNNLLIVEPPATLVNIFETICGPMNANIRSLFLSTEVLTKVRDSLLPRLMSGELQFPEEMLAS